MEKELVRLIEEKIEKNMHLGEHKKAVEEGLAVGEEKEKFLSAAGIAAAAAEAEDREMHVVFSTDCSFYQDWQSLVMFHSAHTVGQKGSITRIASGCGETKQAELVALYAKLWPQYHVHFTPSFSQDKKTQKAYEFYNKPFGLQHWLENANPPIKSGVLIGLIDPDMIFLRPLTDRIRGEENNLFMRGFRLKEDQIQKLIGKGQPAAQLYGLGAPWADSHNRNFNRTHVCGEGSPCLKVITRYGEEHYSVGPPYLVEKDDMVRLTKSWTEMVPKVYEKYPELLAEMYAYSMAAAHVELPHLTMLHYMVSNTDAHDEGWKWVDALGSNVCEPPVDGIYYPHVPLPTFAHYCQFFRAGELGFQKRRVGRKMFTCEHPMLIDPPRDLGNVTYKNRDGEIIKIGKTYAKRNAFMLCTIHRAINAALVDYKQRMCTNGEFINHNKTINLAVVKY